MSTKRLYYNRCKRVIIRILIYITIYIYIYIYIYIERERERERERGGGYIQRFISFMRVVFFIFFITIKLVKKFKYLGYMITSDGKCITEIKKRIATAKDAFQKLSLILKNRNISMTTKFRVLKTYVWSTLTYGCECWTITSDIEKKIEAAEMWFIRRMLRISWTEKKTNVNVLREGNVQRSLLKTIRKRQMEFLGHVCRRRGLEFLSLTGKVEGKRDRGKQRLTFLDSLCNSATGGQSKGLNFLKLSDDRDVWRGMVANVCSRSGT